MRGSIPSMSSELPSEDVDLEAALREINVCEGDTHNWPEEIGDALSAAEIYFNISRDENRIDEDSDDSDDDIGESSGALLQEVRNILNERVSTTQGFMADEIVDSEVISSFPDKLNKYVGADIPKEIFLAAALEADDDSDPPELEYLKIEREKLREIEQGNAAEMESRRAQRQRASEAERKILEGHVEEAAARKHALEVSEHVRNSALQDNLQRARLDCAKHMQALRDDGENLQRALRAQEAASSSALTALSADILLREERTKKLIKLAEEENLKRIGHTVKLRISAARILRALKKNFMTQRLKRKHNEERHLAAWKICSAAVGHLFRKKIQSRIIMRRFINFRKRLFSCDCPGVRDVTSFLAEFSDPLLYSEVCTTLNIFCDTVSDIILRLTETARKGSHEDWLKVHEILRGIFINSQSRLSESAELSKLQNVLNRYVGNVVRPEIVNVEGALERMVRVDGEAHEAILHASACMSRRQTKLMRKIEQYLEIFESTIEADDEESGTDVEALMLPNIFHRFCLGAPTSPEAVEIVSGAHFLGIRSDAVRLLDRLFTERDDNLTAVLRELISSASVHNRDLFYLYCDEAIRIGGVCREYATFCLAKREELLEVVTSKFSDNLASLHETFVQPRFGNLLPEIWSDFLRNAGDVRCLAQRGSKKENVVFMALENLRQEKEEIIVALARKISQIRVGAVPREKMSTIRGSCRKSVSLWAITVPRMVSTVFGVASRRIVESMQSDVSRAFAPTVDELDMERNLKRARSDPNQAHVLGVAVMAGGQSLAKRALLTELGHLSCRSTPASQFKIDWNDKDAYVGEFVGEADWTDPTEIVIDVGDLICPQASHTSDTKVPRCTYGDLIALDTFEASQDWDVNLKLWKSTLAAGGWTTDSPQDEVSDIVSRTDISGIPREDAVKSLSCEDIAPSAPSGQLSKLESLDISLEGIDSLGTALASCTNLRKLVANVNSLRRVDSLCGSCPNLEQLFLKDNKISSMKGIDGCTSLQVLHLDTNCLNRMAPEDFERMTSLRDLSITHNKLVDGPGGDKGLTRCISLERLNISHNLLSNTRGFSGNRRLQHLDMSHNNVKGIEFFHHNPLLQTLILSGNRIRCLPATYGRVVMTGFALLRELRLAGNGLEDLGGMKWLPLLRSLDVSDNRLGDLNACQHCPSLVKVDATFNQIISVSGLFGLARCSRLRHLRVGNNPLLCAQEEDTFFLRQPHARPRDLLSVLSTLIPSLESLDSNKMPHKCSFEEIQNVMKANACMSILFRSAIHKFNLTRFELCVDDRGRLNTELICRSPYFASAVDEQLRRIRCDSPSVWPARVVEACVREQQIEIERISAGERGQKYFSRKDPDSVETPAIEHSKKLHSVLKFSFKKFRDCNLSDAAKSTFLDRECGGIMCPSHSFGRRFESHINKLASRIQAFVKGFLVRRSVPPKVEVAEGVAQVESAERDFMPVANGFCELSKSGETNNQLLSLDENINFISQTSASTKIQARFRGWVFRKKFRDVLHTAISVAYTDVHGRANNLSNIDVHEEGSLTFHAVDEDLFDIVQGGIDSDEDESEEYSTLEHSQYFQPSMIAFAPLTPSTSNNVYAHGRDPDMSAVSCTQQSSETMSPRSESSTIEGNSAGRFSRMQIESAKAEWGIEDDGVVEAMLLRKLKMTRGLRAKAKAAKLRDPVHRFQRLMGGTIDSTKSIKSLDSGRSTVASRAWQRSAGPIPAWATSTPTSESPDYHGRNFSSGSYDSSHENPLQEFKSSTPNTKLVRSQSRQSGKSSVQNICYIEPQGEKKMKRGKKGRQAT